MALKAVSLVELKLGVWSESERSGGAGRSGEHPERRPRMPPLPDMPLPHADSDPGTNLVTGDGGGEKVAPADRRFTLENREDWRQRDRPHVKDTDPMHVVELEALHQGAIYEDGMRRRQPIASSPNGRRSRLIYVGEGFAQDPAPREVSPIDRATERVEHEELDAGDNIGGNHFVSKTRYEPCDRCSVRIARIT